MPTRNVNLAPYDAQQAEIERRRRMAQLLQQQGMQSLEMPQQPGAAISPYAGLAKILQSFMGSYQEGKLDKKQRELAAALQADREKQAQATAQAVVPPANVPSMSIGMDPNMTGLPAPGDDPKRAQQVQAFARALSSPDPMQQQMAPVMAGDIYARQREGRAATREQTQAERDQAFKLALLGQKPPDTGIGNINPNDYTPVSLQKFRASGNFADLAPVTPTEKPVLFQPENVMLDGKEAKVLRDPQGNYFDANTRKSVTGRITPYNPPPSPRQRGEITPNAEANLIGNLNRQWDKASKDVQELYRANTIMNAGMDAARKGDINAGSQAVLITFQKFLDPQSVVRESEYARSAQGLAMADRIRGFMGRLAQGGAGVPLPELEAFAKLAQEINSRLASEGNSLLSAEKQRITRTAERYNVPPELAIPAYNYAQPGGTGPIAPTAGGAAPDMFTLPDGRVVRKQPDGTYK